MRIRLSGLPEWVSVDDVRAWLAASELVADEVVMVCDPVTQYPSGAVLIDTPNEVEAKTIMARFDNAPLENVVLKCSPAGTCETPRLQSLSETTIFVGGWPPWVREANVRNVLDDAGIAYFDVQMPTYPDGASRRFAFIQTNEPKRLINEFDGMPFKGLRLVANIARSQRRDFIRPENR